MDAYTTDRWARGDSPVHRARPASKLVGVGLGIAAISWANAPWPLTSIVVVWLAAIAWTGLPFLRVVALGGYATLFATLYALLDFEEGWGVALVLVLKAFAAACAVISMVVTTPYPALFQALRPVMPLILLDALMLTYRSIFILLHRWDHLYTALRLRGGLDARHPARSMRSLAPAFGTWILAAMNHSEGLYEAMLLRGYQGRYAPQAPLQLGRWDAVPLAAGGTSLLAVLWPGATVPVAAGATLLLLAGLGRRR